jgi:hypothetical protein
MEFRVGVVGTPAIPALRRLRQEDHEFKTSLAYISRPYFKNTAKKKKKS